MMEKKVPAARALAPNKKEIKQIQNILKTQLHVRWKKEMGGRARSNGERNVQTKKNLKAATKYWMWT